MMILDTKRTLLPPPSKLLYFGPAAAVLFHGLVLMQALARPEYEPLRHPLSLLAVGAQGWVQTMNFILSGLLLIAFAAGVRRSAPVGATTIAAPLLLALYGCGMVMAGIFPSDPIDGFPLGARQPATMSADASLHGMGFLVAQVSLVLVCVVFAWRFARLGSSRWSLYCMATAALTPAAASLGFGYEPTRGLAFMLAGALGLGWVAAVGLKLSASPQCRPPA